MSNNAIMISNYLSNCNGFENNYFDRMFPGVKYSDGVKLLRDNGCNWMVVDMLVHLVRLFKSRPDEFYSIEFKKSKNGSGGMLVFSDGNGTVYKRQRYDYADAPFNMSFFCEFGMLMFTAER